MMVFNLRVKLFIFTVFFCGLAATSISAQESLQSLSAAKFDQNGALIRPDDLDRWIHLRSSLGQGYKEELFDPKKTGTFQIVEMEPNAYDYFKQYGRSVECHKEEGAQ